MFLAVITPAPQGGGDPFDLRVFLGFLVLVLVVGALVAYGRRRK